MIEVQQFVCDPTGVIEEHGAPNDYDYKDEEEYDTFMRSKLGYGRGKRRFDLEPQRDNKWMIFEYSIQNRETTGAKSAPGKGPTHICFRGIQIKGDSDV